LGDLQEFYAGEDDMGSSIAPGMAKLVGDAPVWKRTQSLGCNRRAGDIARQSFKPRWVVSVYRDSCMETEALHAGAALPRGNSVLQRGCGTGGEQRVFIQQRAFGCSTMIREQAATLKEAEMMPLAVAAATRAISWSSGAGRGKSSGEVQWIPQAAFAGLFGLWTLVDLGAKNSAACALNTHRRH
jgi:hypothetical protein